MPSWLSGVIEHSILKRHRSFAGLAGTTLAEWDHLDERAQQAIDNELQRLSEDPTVDLDEDEQFAQACFAGDEFLDAMMPLAQSMLNLFTVGVFHLFEQQLVDFTRTVHGSLDVPDKMEPLIANLSGVLEIDIANAYSMMGRLRELRLFANVVKHAEGGSAEKLQLLRPDLFEHPDVRRSWDVKPSQRPLLRAPLAGEGLYVARDDFVQYTQDVQAFWRRLMIDLDRVFA